MGRGIALQIRDRRRRGWSSSRSRTAASTAQSRRTRIGCDGRRGGRDRRRARRRRSARRPRRSPTTGDPAAPRESVDAMIEVHGDGRVRRPRHVLDAIEGGKHVVLMNAELDGTVGPILKTYADRAGVVFTNADGDQPGVIDEPLPLRHGDRRAARALREHQGPPRPVPQPDHPGGVRAPLGTEPAHGDLIRGRHEDLVRAGDRRQRDRACGCAKRGMLGPTVEPGTPIEQAAALVPARRAARRGRGSSTTSSAPRPGPASSSSAPTTIPGSATTSSSTSSVPGRFYCFYTPYHLCHFEVPTTVARAVLFADAAIAPLGAPTVEVVATAKTDLERRPGARRHRRLHDVRPLRERRGRRGAKVCCRSGSRRAPRSRATFPRTRSSRTRTWSSPMVGSATACAPSRKLARRAAATGETMAVAHDADSA